MAAVEEIKKQLTRISIHENGLEKLHAFTEHCARIQAILTDLAVGSNSETSKRAILAWSDLHRESLDLGEMVFSATQAVDDWERVL